MAGLAKVDLLDAVYAADDDGGENGKTQIGGHDVDELHADKVDDIGDPEEEAADNQRAHLLLLHLDEGQRHERAETRAQHDDHEDQEGQVLEQRQHSRQLDYYGCHQACHV